MAHSQPRYAQGFTLVETIMVIVIIGILGAMVAVFIKRPVDAYMDNARRAALSDVADTAVRRMSRDIHKALPNSIRQPSSNNQCIEFIPTKTGGRYRSETNSTGAGDILDFTTADTSFDMFGLNSTLPADQQIAPNDIIAIYNLGILNANAYNADNTSTVTAVAAGGLANETHISITGKQFPLASGSNRFHVIPANEKIVSYVCDTVNHVLIRTADYAYTTSCPSTGAVLAQNVSSCNFVYDASNQHNALVQIQINMTDNGETVSLYHEVHVNNTP